MQLDFMARVDGIRSFEAVRARAIDIEFEGYRLLVASLDDIIRSKESAGREQDLAVLPIQRRTRVKTRKTTRPARASALRKESDRALLELIRRQLALPPNQRTNFLRVRLPGGGSAL